MDLSETGQDLRWVEGSGTWSDNPEPVSQVLAYLNDIESDSDEKDQESSQLSFSSSLDITEPKDSPKCLPTSSNSKDAVFVKPGGSGWLLTPVYAKWNQLTNNNKIKEIRALVHEFYRKLKAISGIENIPPDVTALVELILGTDVDLFGSGTTSSANEDPFLLSNPSGFLKPFLRLWKSETDELRRVLDGVVQLLVGITEMTLEIVKAINIHGILETGTHGHGLLYFFYQKMITLLANLEVMYKLARRNFQAPTIPEVIYGSLKVPMVSAFKYPESGFESHVQFSTFTHVETLASINCESLMRLAACLCFIKSIDLDRSQQLKLSGICTDLILSSDNLHNRLKSYLVEYKTLEILENTLNDDVETSPLNQFSRETRILKQYKSIEIKTIEFSDQLKILGTLAETLAGADNPEDSTQLKDVMISKQAEAELTLRNLVTLFEAQTMLVHRLGQNIPTKIQPQPPKPDVDDSLARIGSFTEDPAEEPSNATVEFKTAPTDECEEIHEIGNSDEVFVGALEDIDNNDLGREYTEIDMEEKLVSKLYSGVVTQLREALKPVKTKMKERERVALKKTYGSDLDDSEEDSDEDSEILTTIPKFEEDDTLKSKSGKTFVNKYRYGSDDEETSAQVMESGPTSFGNPFMDELRSKLNTGLGVGYMNASEEESFSDSGGDESDDENE